MEAGTAMTTNQTPEQAVDAAVERVMGSARALCADFFITCDQSRDPVSLNEYFRSSAQIAAYLTTLRTELEARYEAGRRDGMVEGLEKGCNALHWIKSRVAATSKQKQDVIEWDETLHQAIREAKALATPTETKPTEDTV